MVSAATILALLVAVATTSPAAELPLRVQGVMAHRSIPADSISIHVRNLTRQKTELVHNAEVPRTPASVMKLVTTLAALDTLGPAYTWKTEVYLLGEVRDGTLHGDLLLKGYGDPYLVTERMWQLQHRLRRQGIRRIKGDLLLDDSWFDVGPYDPAAFDHEPLRAYNVGPNALMTNYNVVRYLFSPDAASGSVNIVMDPPLQNLQVINRLAVRPGACRGYQRGIAISPNEDYDRFIFSGQFPAGCELYAMDRRALSHNAYTYGLFRSIWQESGGQLDGGWKNVTASADEDPELLFESLPLAQIIRKVNKYSNNVMARQLLFTLAAESHGPPGTETQGRSVVREWLADRGIALAGLKLDNGSGLSRDARITAAQLAAILDYAFQSRYMPEFLSSLSLSGVDGTLSRRFQSDALTGVAHMKSGSLDHVSSLAGYVLGQSGDRYSVVVMINHEDIHRGPGEELQEALLHWVRER